MKIFVKILQRKVIQGGSAARAHEGKWSGKQILSGTNIYYIHILLYILSDPALCMYGRLVIHKDGWSKQPIWSPSKKSGTMQTEGQAPGYGEHGGITTNYNMSKNQLPILHSKLLCKMGHYFLDTQYKIYKRGEKYNYQSYPDLMAMKSCKIYMVNIPWLNEQSVRIRVQYINLRQCNLSCSKS